MTRRSHFWRDEAAAGVMVSALEGLAPLGSALEGLAPSGSAVEGLAPPGSALVMCDPRMDVAQALSRMGIDTQIWDRRLRRGEAGPHVQPWPPDGPFDLACLRLPKAKDELDMSVHAAISALRTGGRLLVYGAKDEGIGSAAKRIATVLGSACGPVVARLVKRHCRVLSAERCEGMEVRAPLSAWRKTASIEIMGQSRDWVSYPGTFAHGRLDPGSALLISGLPAALDSEGSGGSVDSGSDADVRRVLDYGCGTGVLGAAVHMLAPDASLELLDSDVVALEAARENVGTEHGQRTRLTLAASLEGALGPPFDLIVSNPPYHEGKPDDLGVVGRLIDGAPSVLTANGVLALVVQARLPVEGLIRSRFREVTSPLRQGPHRVWVGSGAVR